MSGYACFTFDSNDMVRISSYSSIVVSLEGAVSLINCP